MSDFDPTTNRVQFGLLSSDEWAALVNWPHGWEFYTLYDGCWNATDSPAWGIDIVYRGKPAPVVTSVWLNVYPSYASLPYKSRTRANYTPCSDLRIAVLRIDTCNGVSTAHLEDM